MKRDYIYKYKLKKLEIAINRNSIIRAMASVLSLVTPYSHSYSFLIRVREVSLIN